MDTAIGDYVRHGWRVESRTDYHAVIVKGHRPNNTFHLIMTIITVGLWIPVWLIVGIMSGEKRATLSVDEYGNRWG
jgi:hypothetical protein